MTENVIKFGYWLGVLCSVIAVVSRASGMFGVTFNAFPEMGSSIVYQRFVDRACFFFIISIATTTYVKSRKVS